MFILGAATQSARAGRPILSAALVLLAIFVIILALVLAFQCNPGRWQDFIWPLLGAIFFPEIYVIQFGVRKMVGQKGYCKAVKFAGH